MRLTQAGQGRRRISRTPNGMAAGFSGSGVLAAMGWLGGLDGCPGKRKNNRVETRAKISQFNHLINQSIHQSIYEHMTNRLKTNQSINQLNDHEHIAAGLWPSFPATCTIVHWARKKNFPPRKSHRRTLDEARKKINFITTRHLAREWSLFKVFSCARHDFKCPHPDERARSTAFLSVFPGFLRLAFSCLINLPFSCFRFFGLPSHSVQCKSWIDQFPLQKNEVTTSRW